MLPPTPAVLVGESEEVPNGLGAVVVRIVGDMLDAGIIVAAVAKFVVVMVDGSERV